MVNNNNIIDKINNYLLDTENYADEFLPLRATLEPIQNDFKSALSELKKQAENADDLADRVFYLNRYTDLVRKIEGVFDTRSKRLQQTLSMLTKLPQLDSVSTTNDRQTDESDSMDEDKKDLSPLTPEEANEILKILNKAK